MVKHDFPFKLYGHCLGASTLPRLTITTHFAEDGKTIWVSGGQLAEEGVEREAAQQCEFARKELQALFPWLDFSTAQFAAFRIDRVEAKQTGLLRPDSFSIKTFANYCNVFSNQDGICPRLAETLLAQLSSEMVPTGRQDTHALVHFLNHFWQGRCGAIILRQIQLGQTDISVSAIGPGTVKFGRNQV